MKRATLENASAIVDDYFSALLAMGRRARLQKDECFLVSAKYSRSALAVIDLATGVFGAKVSRDLILIIFVSCASSEIDD